MLLVLLNPNLDGVKMGASGHATSTGLGRIVREKVDFRGGLPGNKRGIFVSETSVWCDKNFLNGIYVYFFSFLQGTLVIH